MASSFGGTIKLQGESEYRRALREISSNLKVMTSELKVVSSAYDKNDNAVENLAQQNTILNKKIDEQYQKVLLLTKALNDSRDETGESSETTKKWQVELNNAKAELNKLEEQQKQNTREMNDYDDATEDASQSTLKLGDIIKANLISDAIIGGIRALGSAMKSVGSALVDMGKQSVALYGEYEQLIGGVETLFGDSSQLVQEYADNAFKTAGISANEYMKQVTNFSASLLQSLGGDTQASAEYANIAVMDMADNANKMGTSMESIQNAYQGFAKANYTMLDNLKLGYGGTKGEMERLLADAGALVGKKFDISNLSDVIEAIHIIQQQIGITGTTALEAEGTIQGSTLAMKASWQNLLTGIADENADLDTLINNFVESTIGAMGNLLPRITQAVSGLGKLIGGLGGALLENLPMLIDTGRQMILGIADGISSAIPNIVPIFSELGSSLLAFLSEQAPLMIQSGVEMLNNLGQGLQENMPSFISKGLDLLQGFANFLTENVPILIQNGMSFIRNLVRGLMDSLPELLAIVPELISQFANVINDNAPTIIMEGVGIIWDIITGLIKAIPDLIKAIPSIIQAIVDVWQAFDWINLGTKVVKFLGDGILGMVGWAKSSIGTVKDGVVEFIKDLPSSLWSIGKNAVSDLGSAIRSMIGWVVSNATSVATNIIRALKNFLSPSNLMSIGKDMIRGLWNGISNMAGWIMDKIGGFASSVVSGIKGFFGIKSPSKVFKDEVGKNLALGLGEGFTNTMSDVTSQMQNSIPTEFDVNANMVSSYGNISASKYSNLDIVNALDTIAKSLTADSLYDVMTKAINDGGFTIVLDNREVGRLVKKYA